jgi:deoxyribonuclease IV
MAAPAPKFQEKPRPCKPLRLRGESDMSDPKMKDNRAEPLIGAHMSIAGGVHRAFDHGAQAGCRTIQIFLKNSNQWKGREITEGDAELFFEGRRRTGIQPVIAHSSYLINVASPQAELHRKSIEALADELRRANLLAVPWLVLHPGAHMGAGTEDGTTRAVAALNRVLDSVAPPAGILLENTAGQGTVLGSRFEELAAILEQIRQQERIGVCLDTCHLFAAGYDIGSGEGYGTVIGEFQRLIGLRRVKAFHVNDSKRERGARVDRHAHIGRGFIGLEGFRRLMNDRRFARVPKILETPKGKDLAEDLVNLGTLRGLVDQVSHRKVTGAVRAACRGSLRE